MKEWFKDWFNTPFHDELYAHRDEEEACKFIDALIQHLNPRKEAKMLDLACGKGRHSAYLAQKGFDVTGLDLAEKKIAAAQQQYQHQYDHLQFKRHDMRLPFGKAEYDYVFSFFTSLGYFEQSEEDFQTFHNISQALRPKGKLVIDFLNIDYAIKHLKLTDEFQIKERHYRIEKRVQNQKIVKDIFVNDNGEKYHFQEKVSAFTENNFHNFLGRVGLEALETFGNYQLAPFELNNSPRLIIIAQKTE